MSQDDDLKLVIDQSPNTENRLKSRCSDTLKRLFVQADIKEIAEREFTLLQYNMNIKSWKAALDFFYIDIFDIDIRL